MKRCFIFCCILLYFILPCAAKGELWSELGLERLERAGKTYGSDVTLDQNLQLDDGIASMAERTAHHLPKAIGSALKSALMLLTVVLLCAMADGVNSLGGAGALPVPVMAGTLAITAITAGNMSSMMGLGRSTIESMNGFAQILLPAMAACTAASGSLTGAAVRQVATTMFANLLLSIIDRFLMPMVYAYVAACSAYAAVGNQGLKQIAQILKWIVTSVLTVLLIAFVTYLTVSGAVAGTADAAAVKATRTAISTAVPVVGRIISDAAETVLVGAGILRSTVGVFGLITVLGICLVPFLRLAVHYLTYKFTCAMAGMLADRRLAELIGNLGTAFGMILGMAGTSTLLLLISIISGISGGAG